MQQQIQIEQETCLIPNHAENILLLCLNADCKENTAVCFKCLIKHHKQCQVKGLNEIAEELTNMQQLYDDMVGLQQRVYNQFKTILHEIELILKPIFDYKELQNLAGLSLIGNMMRGNAKETIIASSHRTINKIKSLLDNLHCESDINPKDAHFWEDKGRKLQLEHKLYNEAIVCFDKAIHLQPQVLRFYYHKGYALNSLSRFEEAIDCFNKTIEIEPNQNSSWYFKGKILLKSIQGELLLEQQRYWEATSCFDTALAFGPEYNSIHNHQFLTQIGSAIECYQKIIGGKPDPNQLSHAHAQLKLAQGIIDKVHKSK